MPCVMSIELTWQIDAAGTLIDVVTIIYTSASKVWNTDG